MKRLLLMCGICLVASSVGASEDCICAKYAMYPVPGGWFHFAYVCQLSSSSSDPCTPLYATGYVLPAPATNQNCTNHCDTCSTAPPPIPLPNMHFAGAPRSHANMNSDGKFRSFLAEIDHGGVAIPEHGHWVYENPRVVALQRTKSGAVETFHALVWKYRRVNGGHVGIYGFAGAEIADTGGQATVAATAQCNAVSTKSAGGHFNDTPIPGLLMVTIGSDIAFVRLSAMANAGVTYPQCPHTPITPTLIESLKSADSSTNSTQPCGTVPCEYVPCDRRSSRMARRLSRRCCN